MSLGPTSQISTAPASLIKILNKKTYLTTADLSSFIKNIWKGIDPSEVQAFVELSVKTWAILSASTPCNCQILNAFLQALSSGVPKSALLDTITKDAQKHLTVTSIVLLSDFSKLKGVSDSYANLSEYVQQDALKNGLKDPAAVQKAALLFTETLKSTSSLHVTTNESAAILVKYFPLCQNLLELTEDGVGLTQFDVEITSARELRTLSLPNNAIPTIPPEIRALSKLTHLNLENNKLGEGSLHAEMGELTWLTHVNVANNQLTESDLLPLLNKWKRLGFLDIRGNSISTEGIQQIQRALPANCTLKV